MARKFSPHSAEISINPCKSKRCKSCGLYLNQFPVLDKNKRKSNVFWVGLSAVQFENHEQKEPLAAHTPSGALIHRIEEPFKSEIAFYKSNLVKCVPIKDNKIRYPSEQEMEKCYPNLEVEINELGPSVVFLLGKQVSTFILKKQSVKKFSLNENFEYECFEIDDITYIPIHHPSFVLVYKRKQLERYITNIQNLFQMLLLPDFCETA